MQVSGANKFRREILVQSLVIKKACGEVRS